MAIPTPKRDAPEHDWVVWGERVRASVRAAATGLTLAQVEKRSARADAEERVSGSTVVGLRSQIVAGEWHRIAYIMGPDRFGRGGMDRYDPAKDPYEPPKGVRL